MEADEVVTMLSASRDLTASVRPPLYSTIAWEQNSINIVPMQPDFVPDIVLNFKYLWTMLI